MLEGILWLTQYIYTATGEPESGVDTNKVTYHHVGEELIFGKPALDVALAVAPLVKFLQNPGEEANWRVVEAVAEGLRFGALFELVPCSFEVELDGPLQTLMLLLREDQGGRSSDQE